MPALPQIVKYHQDPHKLLFPLPDPPHIHLLLRPSLPQKRRNHLQQLRLLEARPVVRVQEVFACGPTSEEQQDAADVFARGDELRPLLHEAVEGCDARAGADHDGGPRRVGGELECGGADVDEDFAAAELGAWAA